MAESFSQPKHRWYQYRLRTLLILITVFAVWFGWKIRRASRQREAVEHLRKERLCDFEFRPRFLPFAFSKRPALLTSVEAEHFFLLYDTSAVRFNAPEMTDEDVANLNALHGLEAIDFVNPCAGDAGVRGLRQLTGLRHVRLLPFHITDSGMEELKTLVHLEDLELHSKQVTDLGLQHLANMPSLQRINVAGTSVTSAGVAQLQKALPNCVITH